MERYGCEFAIKYRVIKLDKINYLLYPVKLLKGEEKGENGFLCEDGEYLPQCIVKDDLKNKYVVDHIYSSYELEYLYDDEDEDVDFLGAYFFEDFKSIAMFININNVDNDVIRYREHIDLKVLDQHDEKIIYYMDHSIPSVVLNQGALSELMSSESLEKMKLLLTKYQRELASLKRYNEEKNITRVAINNGKIEYFDVNGEIKCLDDFDKKGPATSPLIVPKKDITYKGLRDYIKERIYGHEEEIDKFARKLYLNYTAQPGDDIESILLVGPTGTGKTKTVEVACEYLGIPFYTVNTSNLVPQGIVGTSIEDAIIGLYEASGCDIEKAQRGLMFLDEFDKLPDSTLDIKTVVKHILLTFTDGGVFPIDTSHYHFEFNSKMTTKVYAGVFDRITTVQNPIGFTASKMVQGLGSEQDIRKMIVDKKYYTQEELSRISMILPYNELSRDTKKRILMNEKINRFAKKRARILRDFGIEIIAKDEFYDALIEKSDKNSTGMRTINNFADRVIDAAESAILEEETVGYKKLILTKDTVDNPRKFDLSK